MSNVSRRDADFYAWTIEQATLLQQGRSDQADMALIAEELLSLGVSERRELESRLEILVMHLLKWDWQPQRRSKSWRSTIQEQRRKLVRHLRANPSLTAELQSTVAEIYEDAVAAAFRETGIDETEFPKTCPYTEQHLFDPNFPEGFTV